MGAMGAGPGSEGDALLMEEERSSALEQNQGWHSMEKWHREEDLVAAMGGASMGRRQQQGRAPSSSSRWWIWRELGQGWRAQVAATAGGAACSLGRKEKGEVVGEERAGAQGGLLPWS